jgi:transcriptional regulator with XRE-family HTH domain
MRDIERLHAGLSERFPDHTVEIDPAETEAGDWDVNVFRPGLDPVVVVWRPSQGYGICTPTRYDYGVGVSEVFDDWRAAMDRAVQLVESGGSAITPLGLRLMEIRQGAGMTQAQLAEAMGIKQASISDAERRPDAQLSTLARHAAALGGALKLSIEFPDGRSEVLLDPAIHGTMPTREGRGASATVRDARSTSRPRRAGVPRE